MTDHLVVVTPRCLDNILSGRKRVETRLSVTRREPFGIVRLGDRLLIKPTGGAVAAETRVVGVEFIDNLTPSKVIALARRIESDAHAGEDYWRRKRTATFATILRLGKVTPPTGRIDAPRLYGSGWRVLTTSRRPSRTALRPRAARTPSPHPSRRRPGPRPDAPRRS